MTTKKYCNNPFNPSRFLTREVKVGNVIIGGNQPICLQSMTTTDTMDIQGTVDQSIRMIEAGCEIVRITAPSKKEAEALNSIKQELVNKGHHTPLVADIHFTPNAAELAADYVEKVRVNPGNYADKKKFETHDYSDEGYAEELERIRVRFTPLVIKCKTLGRAMRIGTNHGSLSDRIMSRYGDTPLGMVESALEFIRICRDNDYHDLVISMKASNTQVMVQAYRLLVSHMMEEGMSYPLHLGVTEAGEGEDGRIKSAVGIGTLLNDGIGDTIRVSLTEEPEEEIPVARILAEKYSKPLSSSIENDDLYYDPFSYKRRVSYSIQNIGGNNTPIVIGDASKWEHIKAANFYSLGYHYSPTLDKWNIDDMACDYIYVGDQSLSFEIPGTLGIIQNFSVWKTNKNNERHYPLMSIEEYLDSDETKTLKFIDCDASSVSSELMNELTSRKDGVVLLSSAHTRPLTGQRAIFNQFLKAECEAPIVFVGQYDQESTDAFQIHSAADAGGVFIDGFGDGIWIKSKTQSPKIINGTSFGILQATRVRISKTEYISCPSCGRTLFDLQETTAKIRSKTSHLKGLKIGIMGCIVNGPGEMADADYGYVGTGPGKITLYKEKEVVVKNVKEDEAVDALIGLIKEHGDWVEAPEMA